MGAFLDKPKTEKYNESQAGAGLRYGLSSMQGWRIEMEDAHSALIGIPEIGDKVSWFAVFDGHAGSRVSAHCARHLLDCIVTSEDFKRAIKNEGTLSQDELFSKVKTGILNGFLELDEKLRKIPEVANGEDKSGTTAVCALITEKHVLFSNCGDSRGVLSSGGANPVLVTQDHKPSNPPERERIQNAGGSVMIQRVNGSLAVSRALGDFEYKAENELNDLLKQKVTDIVKENENDVDMASVFQRLSEDSIPGLPPGGGLFAKRSFVEDEFLVLACDGVWDVMTNEDICQFIAARMRITDDLELIANEVIDTCLHKGSRDNMSIIIIAFPAAPKATSEAIKAEAYHAQFRVQNRNLIDGEETVCKQINIAIKCSWCA